jgi:hypothetical protein
MNPINFMRRIVLAFCCLAAALYFAQSAQAADPGITVSPAGVMLKDGKPYRAIGGHDPFDSVECFENDNPNYVQTFTAMKASAQIHP